MHTPGPPKAETFAASTGHGTEYGVTFYDDLITMMDERNDADPARIEQGQAETMRFATEIVRRWNAYPDLLAALEFAFDRLVDFESGDPGASFDGADSEYVRAAIRKATGREE